MGFLYSQGFLALMGLLMADVVCGLVLQALARAQLRLGNWEAADRWYRRRLAAPLPATRLLLDGLHGQRPWLQWERLRAMSARGRHREASEFGAELAAARGTPDWLRIVGRAQAAEELTRAGRFGEALTRLEALLADVPAGVPELARLLHVARLPALMALGEWAQAEATARLIDEAPAPGGQERWPVHLLAVLSAKEDVRELLRIARPLVESWERAGEPGTPEDQTSLAAAGLILTARAAAELGWSELRDRVLEVLGAWPGRLPPSPVLRGVEALAAAERGDVPALDAAAEQLRVELAELNEAPGPAQLSLRLLALAESRVGRHEAALARARAVHESASSPTARWVSARTHGEIAEAAGHPAEALEAYRDALATAIESPLVQQVQGRVAQLESA